MPLSRVSFLFAFSLLIPFSSWAEDAGASWLRTRLSNALNPKISLIGDFVGQAGPEQQNKFSFRETELAIQSEVDPYTRADVFLALHDGETIELEEAYITLLSLPFGFQARGGKFLATFGKLNMIHTHELPQVNRPLVLTSFLGREGINDAGIELSRIFTPFNVFTELSYAFINGLGDDPDEEEVVVTTDITDDAGNIVKVPVVIEEAEDTDRALRDFAQVARLRFFKDLTDNSNVEVGFSGALHLPETKEQRRLGGADVTFRWKPVQEGLYKSLIWRTEGLYSKRALLRGIEPITQVELAPAREKEAWGGYSYIEAQFARQWRVGVRGDYVEDPESESLDLTRAVSPYITFNTSEFSRYRLQYQNRHLPTGKTDHTGYLQWTVVLGPHGAHPF